MHNYRNCLICSILLCLLAISPGAGMAGWSSDPGDNPHVAQYQGDQWSHSFVPSDDGGYLVVWLHGYDDRQDGIYAQKIDGNGDRRWGADGVGVCVDLCLGETPRILPDGAGGALVFWLDHRNDASEVWGQRLNADGLSIWGSGGVRFSEPSSYSECLFAVTDEAGGAYLAWDEQESDGGGSRQTTGIVCQHVNGNGTAWSLPVAAGSTGGEGVKIAADGYGNAVFVWVQYNAGTGSDIHGQKIGPDGSLLWGPAGIIVHGATGDQHCPRIVADGAGGALFLWLDQTYRTEELNIIRIQSTGTPAWPGPLYFAWSNVEPAQQMVSDGIGGAIVTYYDSYYDQMCAHHISSTGIDMWGKVRLTEDLAIDNLTRQPTYLVSDGVGGAIAVVCMHEEYRYGTDIYAVRLTADGDLPWGRNGRILSDDADGFPMEGLAAPCTTSSPAGAVACWIDYRHDTAELFYMGINAHGILGDPCSPTTSTWSTDTEENLKVSEEQNYQYSHQIVADGLGGYLISWFHVSPMRQFGNYAQKLDAFGSRMWGPDGIELGLAVSEENPRMCGDGTGGGIFFWVDYRNGGPEVWAQRIGADGSEQWTTGGIQVSPSGEDVQCLDCVSDDAGGAYIVWVGGEETRLSFGVHCQHLDSAGNLLWAVPVTQGGASSEAQKIAADGSGGAIITWSEWDAVSASDIWAQRITFTGSLLWGPAGVRVCGAGNDQACPRLAGTGDGGALFLWRDGRGEGEQLYMQRLLPAGTAAWVTDGVPASDACSWIETHSFDLDGAGGAIATWVSSDDNELYARRIALDGSDSWGFSLAVSSYAYWGVEQAYSPHATLYDGLGGVITAFTAFRPDRGGWLLVAQRITHDMILPWGESGRILCDDVDGSREDARLAGCSGDEGGVLACWRDDRILADALYVMGVTTFGRVGAPCEDLTTEWSTDPGENLRVTATTIGQYGHRIVADGTGGFIICWNHESEPNRLDLAVCAQRFDFTGNRAWGPEGLTLRAQSSWLGQSRVIPDGVGGGFIIWVDSRDEEANLYGQHVDAAGTPLWSAGGIPLSPSGIEVQCPFAVPDNSGGFYVSWHTYGLGPRQPTGVFCHRIASDGSQVWLQPLNLSAASEGSIKITAEGAGGAIITWLEYDPLTGTDIMAQRVDSTGAMLWGATPVAVCDADEYQYCPRVTATGDGGGLFLWSDQRSNMGADVYMQKINANGTAAWADDGILVSAGLEEEVYAHAFTSDGAGGAIVTWLVYDDSNAYACRITAAGTPAWPIIPLTSQAMVMDASYSPDQTVSDGEGGAITFFTTGEEERSGIEIVAQRITQDGMLPWGADGIVLSPGEPMYRSCARAAACGPGQSGALACWWDERETDEVQVHALYVMGVTGDGVFGAPCGEPATPTPVPTETPAPTLTPEPLLTPEPTMTPEPSPTNSPEPTVTPEPTDTPVPTPTPTTPPTATPISTNTPVETPTPTVPPTPAPVPTSGPAGAAVLLGALALLLKRTRRR
ncbi:hypothetical protein JW905_15430 [bacterium]|nr:hypothetical protein [candidate division CSSED10-310 bacterium]